MNQIRIHRGIRVTAVAALWLLASLPVAAAMPAGAGAASVASATPPSRVLAEALQTLRDERRAELQRQARVRLAELGSEAARALARGAAPAAGAGIKAAP